MPQRREAFARRLRDLCRQKSSASAVARDLGINRQQFARYLNGQSLPRDNLIAQISNYFGVSENALFASPATGTDDAQVGATVRALADILSFANPEVVGEEDLPSGFYLQYRQALSLNSRFGISLIRIYREQGVTKYKRRTSVRMLPSLPGSSVQNSNHGVFFKSCGNFVLVEANMAIGDLTFYSFQTTSVFNPDIKPGIHLNTGISGASSAKASLNFLWRIPPGESVLKQARRQGIYDQSQLTPSERHFLGLDAETTPGKISIP